MPFGLLNALIWTGTWSRFSISAVKCIWSGVTATTMATSRLGRQSRRRTLTNRIRLGYMRSKQLRELYENLLEGEPDPLNETAFHGYCLLRILQMRSVYRTLCDDYWEVSASIQTVVCFPYLGGVIELGVTDLVPEDHSLLQHIKVFFAGFLQAYLLLKSLLIIMEMIAEDPMGTKVGAMVLETLYSPSERN
ncbi:hypothetical protein MLD38_023473 [Melastoma candidum]|uniref:Uncharacterized protein n=1 Tax=Melastoma candidum TaxID=119954 RepID=A0ACB9NSQ4_9MYRT|nr:hypothetical protein MLD38_023473 [Melastoma candidum]